MAPPRRPTTTPSDSRAVEERSSSPPRATSAPARTASIRWPPTRTSSPSRRRPETTGWRCSRRPVPKSNSRPPGGRTDHRAGRLRDHRRDVVLRAARRQRGRALPGYGPVGGDDPRVARRHRDPAGAGRHRRGQRAGRRGVVRRARRPDTRPGLRRADRHLPGCAAASGRRPRGVWFSFRWRPRRRWRETRLQRRTDDGPFATTVRLWRGLTYYVRARARFPDGTLVLGQRVRFRVPLRGRGDAPGRLRRR